MSFHLNIPESKDSLGMIEIKLKHDVPFTHNGIKYPATWLRLTTLEEKQAIGIVEEPEPFKGVGVST